MSKGEKKTEVEKVIADNRRARFDYEILETLEAGLVLTGPEIKSIRRDGITLAESYVRPDNEEIFLVGAHIRPYAFTIDKEYDPLRKRKLLLHSNEIQQLIARVQQKGLTIVPLQLYLKRGRAKLRIGLARGKASPDKRESIKERDVKREMARAIDRRR